MAFLSFIVILIHSEMRRYALARAPQEADMTVYNPSCFQHRRESDG